MLFNTADLCDANPDVLVAQPIWKSFGAKQIFAGEIVTIKCLEDNSLVKQQVALPGDGKVLVIDGAGSNRCALLGDMLAEQAVKNNWQGIVVYGYVRDVLALAQMQLGIQALGSHPRRSVKRGIGELNVELFFAGIIIRPGEYLYADQNGIIVAQQALTV